MTFFDWTGECSSSTPGSHSEWRSYGTVCHSPDRLTHRYDRRKWESTRQVRQRETTSGIWCQPLRCYLLLMLSCACSSPFLRVPAGSEVNAWMCDCVWGRHKWTTEAQRQRGRELSSTQHSNEPAAFTRAHTNSSPTTPALHSAVGHRGRSRRGEKDRHAARGRVRVRELERRGEERESCGLLERTAWLQIRDWLRCFCGLYHYRVLARREAAATKVSGLLWTDDVK